MIQCHDTCGATTIVSMTSSSSNSPVPMDAEEPRKKGSRGGKRSVTHLSKAQLARKRANDREAQRNIRQRTKEHIENLERKVKELEQSGMASNIERVLKRNRELEDEVERLRALVSGHHAPVAAAPADLQDELLMPQKAPMPLDWMSESASPGQWSQVSHNPALNTTPEMPTSTSSDTTSNSSQYSTTSAPAYPATTAPMGYDEVYTPTESWGSPVSYGPPTTSALQGMSKAAPAWSSPIDPSFSSQPSRYADMQMAGFGPSHAHSHSHGLPLVNAPPYSQGASTSWQNQPLSYSFH
ncbi:bZIP transcription factor [Diplocarpon mali]|nr:bZIP transcription factor [Diplocarpon mali]